MKTTLTLTILLLCLGAQAQELVPDARTGVYKGYLKGYYDRAYLQDMYVVFADSSAATGHLSHMVGGIAPVRIDYRLQYSDTLVVVSHFRLTGSTPAVVNLEDLPAKHRDRWIAIINKRLASWTGGQ